MGKRKLRFLTSGKIIAGLVLIIFLLPGRTFSAAPSGEDQISVILNSAESLFRAMKAKDYPSIWQLISVKSRASIVGIVRKNAKKSGAEIEPRAIEDDFRVGGRLARAYWEAYLYIFDPEIALEQCAWSLGRIDRNRAEIKLLFRKSSHPAILQMFLEQDQWKVGLSETFDSRNIQPF